MYSNLIGFLGRSPQSFKLFAEIVVVVAVYFATARIGQLFTIPPGNVAPVWLPSSIMLAWAMIRGHHIWPGVFLGAFFGSVWVYFDPTSSSLMLNSILSASANGLGGVISTVGAAWLIKRFTGVRNPFDKITHLSWFLLFGVALGPMGCVLFGVTALALIGFLPWGDYGYTLATCWAGVAVGAAIITPLLIATAIPEGGRLSWNRRPEMLINAALLLLVSLIALYGTPSSLLLHPAMFLLAPIMIWAAIRLEEWYAFLAIVVVAAIAILVTFSGRGPFASDDLKVSLIHTQFFIGVLGLTIFYLRAGILERSPAQRTHAEEIIDKFFSQPMNLHLIAGLDGSIYRMNKGWERILGYSEEALEGSKFLDLIHPDDVEATLAEISKLGKGETTFYFENRYRHKNGDYRTLAWSAIASPEDQIVYAVASDITEQKAAEENLLKVNKALKMISKANEALVHATNEEQLLNDVIRIIVEEGGFRMAWIGYAENDPAKTVRPVAHYGYEHGYTETLDISWDEDNERGQGPTGTAIRKTAPVTCSDFLNDEIFMPWKDDALERGYQSSVSLPLLTDGEVIGALNIYAPTPYAFDDDNIPLLMALATDLAYGIQVLRAKETQIKNENKLRWDVAVDQALMEISRTILAGDVLIDDVAGLILDQVRTLTRSQFGFVGYIDTDTGFLVCPTFTRDIWDQCKVEDKSAIFEKFTGLFGWVLNNKEPLLTNDPRRDPRSTGVPPGHIPIEKFLAVPVLVGDELLGEIAIANPVTEYGERDLFLLEHVANFYALALQQMRASEKIKDSEQLFRRLFEGAEVSIWNEDLSDVCGMLNQLHQNGVTDLRHYLEKNEQVAFDMAAMVKVLQVNEATLRLFGAKSNDEMIYKIDKTFGPGAIKVFIDELCAIWDKQGVFRSEATLRTLDGKNISVIISFQIPDTDDGFKSIPVSIIDITERLEVEQQLWQSQKVESIGNLAGGIAHDINNMLLPIQALTDMTMKEMPEDSRAFKRLEKVLEASGQAKNLVSRILTFSRKEEPKMERINLAETVRSVINLLRSTVPSTLAIKTQIKNVGDVMADASQIHAVLMNLASNSADAMEGNVGNLSISLSKKKTSKKDAILPSIDEGKTYGVLRVKDNGHGIEKSTMHRLFDPFFTTKGAGEGTGLGLSIVHGIITRHKGAVKVNSAVGKGTTFEIFLPIVD